MEYDIEKISNNIQRKKKIGKIFQIFLFSILGFLFFITTFFINYNQDTDEPNNFFGIYIFDIISKSMVPTLQENDIIIVKKIDLTELKINDMISFRNNEKIISHRIIKIEKDKGKLLFTTKGDNNKLQDDFKVGENQIYGKIVFNIHGIGKQIRYLHEKNGLMIIIIVICFIFIIYRLKEKKKYTRKKLRWKYETKQKREKYMKEASDE